MLQLRALDTLGGGNRDWLEARHHFAVDRQGNPAHRGVQVITAGRGVRHCEYNDTNTCLRIFQIWLLPSRRGLDPRWATKPFADMQRPGRIMPIASGLPEDQDALRIEAGARVLGATIEAGQCIAYPLASAIEPAEIILVDTA